MTPQSVVEALRRRALDQARTAEIYQATLAELADHGYDRMTMDAVARRAGASKATLYRHWPGKPDLVVDALRHLRGDDAEPPDSGSLRSDLLTVLAPMGSQIGEAQVCLMRGMVSACGQDAELARVFHERFVQAKRAAVVSLLERARERGEVSEAADIQLLVDVVPAMVLFRRLMTPHPVDNAYLERLVDEVWLPLLTGSPTDPARRADPQGEA